MLCSEYCLVKYEPRQTHVIPLLCRCWSCDYCRPIRSKQLISEALAGAPDLFITLTSRVRPSMTPDQAAQALVLAWRKIRREYIKEHGKGSLPFLAVFEETKQGWPHLHLVARCKWLSQKWLSERMADLHDSPVVDVRRVTDQKKVAYYVTKYCGKNPYHYTGVKRYWRSMDYLFPPSEDELARRRRAVPWSIHHCTWRVWIKEHLPLFDRIDWEDQYAVLWRYQPP